MKVDKDVNGTSRVSIRSDLILGCQDAGRSAGQGRRPLSIDVETSQVHTAGFLRARRPRS